MAKSLKLNNEQYWDTSSIVHNKEKLSEYIDKSTSCARFKVSKTITLNKPTTYGGVQILLDEEIFNYGDIFELKDGHVYCKKDAIIQIDFSVATYLGDGYIMYGHVNGGYREIAGASSSTSLVGNVYTGSGLINMKKGDYVTFALGRSSAYSNIAVHNTTGLSVSVKRLL